MSMRSAIYVCAFLSAASVSARAEQQLKTANPICSWGLIVATIKLAENCPGTLEQPIVAELAESEVVLREGLFADRAVPPEMLAEMQSRIAKIYAQPFGAEACRRAVESWAPILSTIKSKARGELVAIARAELAVPIQNRHGACL